MFALGARASTGAVDWCVVSASRAHPKLESTGTIRCPKSFNSEASSLRHVREQFQSLLREMQVSSVALRIPDFGKPSSKLYARLRMEGVLLECCATQGTHVETIQWPTIASRLAMTKSAGKKASYMTSSDFRGASLSTLSASQTEAFYAACSLLEEQ